MFSTLRSFVLDGIAARPVPVEVVVDRGLPSFTIVGLPDSAGWEARERIRAALVNSGLEFPLRRIVVNLAPAGLRSSSSALDLPIAIALLAASGQLEPARLQHVSFVGGLDLDGSLRPVEGVLAFAETIKRLGGRSIVVPAANGREAALAEGIDVLAPDHLGQIPALCSGDLVLGQPEALPLGLTPTAGSPDLGDLRGQPELRGALELAAAGGHSMLMVAPPGSGKAMAAARLPSILPPLLRSEAREVARIASATGRLGGAGWRGGRPFRAPHHTISPAGLVGGGGPCRPGEVTLAHRGVLFLDQADEVRRDALEALRRPLRCGEVIVSRAERRHAFPARFQLLAAADPCPCGRGDRDPDCSCTPDEVVRHRALIEGALGGHIEIALAIHRPTAEEIAGPPGESSAVVADRVAGARERQEGRLGPGRCNAQMTPEESAACALQPDADRLFGRVDLNRRSGPAARERALRLAQTFADLDGADIITESHLTQALHLLPGAPGEDACRRAACG